MTELDSTAPTVAPQGGAGSRRSPGQSSGTAALHPTEIAYRHAREEHAAASRVSEETGRVEESRRQERNQAILAALAAGKTQRQVAREFGLAQQRIAQIARGERAA